MSLPKKILALVLLCVAVSYTTGNAEGALQNCSVPSSELVITSQEQELLNLVNNYRQENGKGQLSMHSDLVQAASWKSADMASSTGLNHTDSLGRNTPTRLSDCGYEYTTWGENIYGGASDVQNVFNMWKNSSGHNAIMLDGNHKHAGISVNAAYWAMNFGDSDSSSSPVPTTTQGVPTVTSVVSPTSTITPTIRLSPTTSVTPTIFPDQPPTELSISIRLAGIGTGRNNSPKHLTRQVVAGIYNVNNRLLRTGTGFLKYDGKGKFEGIVNLGQVANGTYYVKVVSDFTLVSAVEPQFYNLKYEEVNKLSDVTLIQGDYDQDNVLDIKDFNINVACFQGKKCPVKDAIDLNDDGKSDVIDYNLFLGNFKQYEGD